MLPIHIAHFQQDEVSIQESELQQAGKEEVCAHSREFACDVSQSVSWLLCTGWTET